MRYEIRSANLKGISLSGGADVIQYYESKKDLNLNKNTVCYGDKLVSTKRVKIGFSLKFKFFYRNHWYKKPFFEWSDWNKCFHWLFFMFWFESIYDDVVDKVIKDHLSEYLEVNKNKLPDFEFTPNPPKPNEK